LPSRKPSANHLTIKPVSQYQSLHSKINTPTFTTLNAFQSTSDVTNNENPFLNLIENR